jgi:LasA protease
MPKTAATLLVMFSVETVILACARTADSTVLSFTATSDIPLSLTAAAQYPSLFPPTHNPAQPEVSPTPDQARILPTLRADETTHVVQYGDTLGQIAQAYGVDLNTLIVFNQPINPDLLEVGQIIRIPAPSPGTVGSGFKIIPDSELIFSPYAALFNVEAIVNNLGGYLMNYYEELDGINYSGAEVVTRVATEFSVNPRILLSVLEYQSGWLTQSNPDPITEAYPMLYIDPDRQGLYRQLIWAANNLNRGFYLWQINAVSHWVLVDGSVVPVDATINPGTASVQYLLSELYVRSGWDTAVGFEGVARIYTTHFGNPFNYTLDPILPPGLQQPAMALPFETGATWSFTSGPHGGWGGGSAWAALDFAPPGDALGCVQSDAWVTAVADGLVVRSENGVVVLDLDGDGFEQTGWSVLYLNI